MTTAPFELGKTYLTKAGKPVKIIQVTNTPGYEAVQGDDGENTTLGWRYNRAEDRGRCTGSAFDMSDSRNLIPDRAASDLRALLMEVRDNCLFSDDGGTIGVTEEPHVSADLFSRICEAIGEQPLPSAKPVGKPQP